MCMYLEYRDLTGQEDKFEWLYVQMTEIRNMNR